MTDAKLDGDMPSRLYGSLEVLVRIIDSDRDVSTAGEEGTTDETLICVHCCFEHPIGAVQVISQRRHARR